MRWQDAAPILHPFTTAPASAWPLVPVAHKQPKESSKFVGFEFSRWTTQRLLVVGLSRRALECPLQTLCPQEERTLSFRPRTSLLIGAFSQSAIRVDRSSAIRFAKALAGWP